MLDCIKNNSYNKNLMSNDINSNPLSLSNLFKMGIDFENKIIDKLQQNYESMLADDKEHQRRQQE